MFEFREDVLEFLSFEDSKEFYNKDYVEKIEAGKEKHEFTEYTVKNVKNKMIVYMDFAWRKANDERGLSASRSVSHYRNWYWLLCDDSINFSDLEDNYEPYGKPILVEMCKFLELDISLYEDLY
jgi:hypothetical protein